MLQSYTTIDRLSTPDGGQTKRYKCPVHGGKKRSVAVWWSGGPRAYCHSRQCAQADILAALGITSTTTPSTRFIPLPAKKSDPAVPTASNATPLPPVTPAEGRAYLAGIQTERGGDHPIPAPAMDTVASTGATLTSGATLASPATAGNQGALTRWTLPPPSAVCTDRRRKRQRRTRTGWADFLQSATRMERVGDCRLHRVAR